MTDGAFNRQPKVGQAYVHPVIRAEHVFRLDVPMKDAQIMTVLNRIDDLKEGMLDQTGVVVENALLSNRREQVSSRA